jgi:hypothetical protein
MDKKQIQARVLRLITTAGLTIYFLSSQLQQPSGMRPFSYIVVIGLCLYFLVELLQSATIIFYSAEGKKTPKILSFFTSSLSKSTKLFFILVFLVMLILILGMAGLL